MPGFNIILTYEDRETTETRVIVKNRPKRNRREKQEKEETK
jgi:hypothetical protein